MANLTETSRWEAGICQWKTSDPVQGGANGIDTEPPKFPTTAPPLERQRLGHHRRLVRPVQYCRRTRYLYGCGWGRAARKGRFFPHPPQQLPNPARQWRGYAGGENPVMFSVSWLACLSFWDRISQLAATGGGGESHVRFEADGPAVKSNLLFHGIWESMMKHPVSGRCRRDISSFAGAV